MLGIDPGAPNPGYNPFDPRTMLRAVYQALTPATFFRDRWFKDRITFDTLKVDVDLYREQRAMVPIVSRHIPGQAVQFIDWQSNSYTPPLIEPKMILTWDMLVKRIPGESIYDQKTTEERMDYWMARHLLYLLKSCDRREEWMCVRSLLDGAINLQGLGYYDHVDFQLASTHNITLTGTATWDNAGATPLDNMSDWMLTIAQDTGVMPRNCVMGQKVVRNFVNNAQVQKLAQRLVINWINISADQRKRVDGATFLGTYTTPEAGDIDIFVYPEFFRDDTDLDVNGVPKTKQLFDTNKILLMPEENEFDGRILYGAYTDVANMTQPIGVTRYPRSWAENNANQRYLAIDSLPLAAPVDKDKWLVATVQAAS